MESEERRTAKKKSKAFAVRIVRLYRYLCDEKGEYVLSKQLLRSGTTRIVPDNIVRRNRQYF